MWRKIFNQKDATLNSTNEIFARIKPAQPKKSHVSNNNHYVFWVWRLPQKHETVLELSGLIKLVVKFLFYNEKVYVYTELYKNICLFSAQV